ncbi:YfcC family protein [Staphylococcus pseudintermedius]|nr:YfcC family protein [Staphylococcus pseudintermedius]MCE5564582.1 YfcC family protein [Staphylococcus pseudintermedius]MCE5581535.1 YfcC family protein [Staphylococcus pseudintermedius]
MKQKNGKQFPDAIIIIFTMSVLAALLTYILPSGEYKRKFVGKIKEIIPDSFHVTPKHPTGIMDFFTAIPQGLVESADIIFLVLIIGGAVAIIDSTGATYSGIQTLVEKTKGNQYILIITITLLFGVMHQLGVSGNTVIAFIPIGIMLAKTLKLDAIVGVAIVYLGNFAGGAVGTFDPAIMGVAQRIAGVPLFSGAWYRIIIFIALIIVTMIYICWYTHKINLDPSKSILKDNPFPVINKDSIQNYEKFNKKHFLIIMIFIGSIGVFLYGVFHYKWSVKELSAIFIIAAILVAFVERISPNDFIKIFMEGVRKLAYGAVIIGVARSIIVIFKDAHVLDTITHAATAHMQDLPTTIGALSMFAFNWFFNILVSSGSGQASIVMPIMSPIGDMLGLTRQTTVLAFKLGDGITNIITPFSGVLMSVLAIGGIPWTKWLRFAFPLVLWWTLVGTIFLIIAVFINYGP